MLKTYSINGFTVRKAVEADLKEVINVLVKQFLPKDAGSNAVRRKTIKYTSHATSAVAKEECLCIEKDSNIIGVCIFIKKPIPGIVFLSILESWRNTRASGYLMHYILNYIFKDIAVMFKSISEDFEGMAVKVKGDKYKVDPKIAPTLHKLFGDI